MSTVRRTISLPKAVADRLDAEARRRGISFSRLVAELGSRTGRPSFVAIIDDEDPDLSLRVEEILGRALRRRR